MPTAAHFLYIPAVLLLGVVIGWILGSRAAFGLLDTATRVLTIVRTPYDVAAAQTKIMDAGLPPVLAQRLALGR